MILRSATAVGCWSFTLRAWSRQNLAKEISIAIVEHLLNMIAYCSKIWCMLARVLMFRTSFHFLPCSEHVFLSKEQLLQLRKYFLGFRTCKELVCLNRKTLSCPVGRVFGRLETLQTSPT